MIKYETVRDFEIAIAIIKASKLKNVFLKQVDGSGIAEWDNL